MLRIQIRQLILTIAFLVTTATVAAHNKVVVIPLGEETPTFKTIFYTDERFNGNLGGLSGADAKCQASAATAGVRGQFKAWVGVSVGANTIPGRPDFKYFDLPYNNVDGSAVAVDFIDFLDGNFIGGIKSVTSVSGNPWVWTGLRDEGTVLPERCFNWTSAVPTDFGYVGYPTFFSFSGWSNIDLVSCSGMRALYCFEQ